MRIYQTPALIKSIFPGVIWDLKGNGRSIYLTFDDGPVPGPSEYILDLLDEYDAKATFFCVGENVVKNPRLFRNLLSRNHSIGNHTYHHLNGWRTHSEEYLNNVLKCEQVFKKYGYNASIKFFRPPFGKLRPSQLRRIKSEYKIIMWDVLSMDYNTNQKPENCIAAVKKYTSPGSIIVFHDSLKTENKIKFVLKNLLDYFTTQEYSFCNLEEYFKKEGC